MHILIFFLCGGLSTFQYNRIKNIFNPYIIFNVIWGIATFISGLGLYNIWVPSNYSYILVLIAIITFNIPALLPNFYGNKNYNSSLLAVVNNKNMFDKLYKWANASMCVFFVMLSVLAVNTIIWLRNGNSYERIRVLFFENNVFTNSTIGTLISIYMVYPIWFFSSVLFILNTFTPNKNRVFNNLYLINLLLLIFVSGARGDVYVLITLLLTINLIYMNKTKETRKNRFKVNWIYYGVALIAMSIITLLRSLNRQSPFSTILKTVIVYFVGPIKFLENSIQAIWSPEILLYGRGFFGGVLDIFILFFRFIGFKNIKTAATIIGTPVQTASLIGDNQYFNALPTMIYTFYCDFGLIGVFLGSFLFGFMAKIAYELYQRTSNIYALGIYLTLVVAIVQSTLNWIFLSPWPWYTIILFLIMYKLDKPNNETQIIL